MVKSNRKRKRSGTRGRVKAPTFAKAIANLEYLISRTEGTRKFTYKVMLAAVIAKRDGIKRALRNQSKKPKFSRVPIFPYAGSVEGGAPGLRSQHK